MHRPRTNFTTDVPIIGIGRFVANRYWLSFLHCVEYMSLK